MNNNGSPTNDPDFGTDICERYNVSKGWVLEAVNEIINS